MTDFTQKPINLLDRSDNRRFIPASESFEKALVAIEVSKNPAAHTLEVVRAADSYLFAYLNERP